MTAQGRVDEPLPDVRRHVAFDLALQLTAIERACVGAIVPIMFEHQCVEE